MPKMTNDQMPSFAMFCLMHGNQSFESALIDTFDHEDECIFKNTFRHVSMIQEQVDFLNENTRQFNLIGLQDIQTAARKRFPGRSNPASPVRMFALLHDWLTADGLLVFGYAGRKIREKLYRQIPFYKSLRLAGFSEIKCFYAIPSHTDIRHVCCGDVQAVEYYMNYMYPGTGSRYKKFLRSCLEKAGLIKLIMPACLITARY